MLPNYSPYIPRLFKVLVCGIQQSSFLSNSQNQFIVFSSQHLQKLTVLVGEPIDFTALLKSHCHDDLCTSAVVLRKQITDIIQKKLYELKNHAETLHVNWTVKSPVAYRTL